MLAGRVPARGEVIRHPAGAEFEVVDADPRRIKRLRVRLSDRPEARASRPGGARLAGRSGAVAPAAPVGRRAGRGLRRAGRRWGRRRSRWRPPLCSGWPGRRCCWRRRTGLGGRPALGWAVGAGYFAVALAWIVEPFLVDVARHGWMAPFALVLMAGGLALFWGAAFWAAGADRGHAAGPGSSRLPARWRWPRLRGRCSSAASPGRLLGYVWTETPLLHARGARRAARADAADAAARVRHCAAGGARGADLASRWRSRCRSPSWRWRGWWQARAPLPDRAGADPSCASSSPTRRSDEKWDPDRRWASSSGRSPSPRRRRARPRRLARDVAALLAGPGRARLARDRCGGRRRPVLLGAQRVEDGRALTTRSWRWAPMAGCAHLRQAPPRAVRRIRSLGRADAVAGAAELRRPRRLRVQRRVRGRGCSTSGRSGRALPLICYEAIFPRDVAGRRSGRTGWCR